MKNLNKITTLSMLIAVAIVLNVIEMSINVIPVPGAKIGFANIVTVIVLYMYGCKSAGVVTILRVFLVGLLSRSVTIPFWMGIRSTILSVRTMGIPNQWFKIHLVTLYV